MPAIECKCGARLAYGEIPNSIEWLLIADAEFEKLAGRINADELYSMLTHMLKCPDCGRLWVFWEGFRMPPAEYSPA